MAEFIHEFQNGGGIRACWTRVSFVEGDVPGDSDRGLGVDADRPLRH